MDLPSHVWFAGSCPGAGANVLLLLATYATYLKLSSLQVGSDLKTLK